MISRQIRNLFQLSRTSIEALQVLHCRLLKTHLYHHEYIFCQVILSATSSSLHHARDLFDHSPITPPPLFAWNTLIRAYSSSSVPGQTIKLFVDLLRTSGGLTPDRFTYPFVIKACGRCSMLGFGGSSHSMVVKAGFASCLHVNHTLLTMYGVCGAIDFSRRVFDEMHQRDVVSWSSMIAAYVYCNLDLNALSLFKDMKIANEKPNMTTFVSLLSACTSLLDARLGKSIHSCILIHGIQLHVGLGTALLRMYGKSGLLEEAFRVFSLITEKNLQCWTVMISCLADYGHGQEALSLFYRMEEVGLRPDSMSFSAILSACSHTGLLHEGRELFEKMVNAYNIMPTMEHYGCMIDLFGRAGEINEAYRIIASMPVEPNSIILRSYLNACKQHGAAVYLDEYLIRLLLKLEPNLGANYVLAGTLSSASGNSNGIYNMRNDMKLKGLKKVPGCSWVQNPDGNLEETFQLKMSEYALSVKQNEC